MNTSDSKNNLQPQEPIYGNVGEGRNNEIDINQLESKTEKPFQILTMNSKGEKVIELQKQLLKLGFLKGGLSGSADGIFGPTTRAAVRAFQENVQLEPDGIVGPKTWAALQELFQEPFSNVTNEVFAVAISPDHSYIIAALSSGDLQLKSFIQGENFTRLFQGHQKRALSVKFSPDGRTIISGSGDKTIRLWNIYGRSLNVLKGHEGQVWTTAFSPDGKIIASGGEDRTIRLWSLEGHSLGIFEGHTDVVSGVTFSPDGKLIASSSQDKTIRLWDLNGNPVGQPFQGHSSYVSSLDFRPSGDILVSGSIDGTVRLWDLSGNPINQPFTHADAVNSVLFIDDRLIVSASSDKTIRVWDVSGSPVGQPLRGHTDIIWSIATVNK